MIDPELKTELDKLHAEINAAYVAAEKTRKYIYWTVVVTVACIVIPLFLLPFAASSLISTYQSAASF